MNKGDSIGARGEAIAISRLAMFCRVELQLPYFVPHFLGEKCQTFDFLVELVDSDDRPRFFFVQVKATQKELTKKQNPPRLRVGVSKKDICQMVACPIPTYVVGVHGPTERAFIIAVYNGMSEGISSMTTAHELTPETLRKLWEEVRDFWQDREMTQTISCFKN